MDDVKCNTKNTFKLPLNIDADIINKFPQEILKNYTLVEDFTDSVKTVNYCFKVKENSTGKLYFMKVCRPTAGKSSEYRIYESMKGIECAITPVKYIAKFGDKYEIYITEFYPEDLMTLILRKNQADVVLDIDYIQTIFKRVYYAVKQLYNNGILYCDIKPENILIDTRGNAYLTDMDMYLCIETEKSVTRKGVYGTPGYQTPEALIKGEYSEKTISWQLGCLLFTMFEIGLPLDTQKFKEAVMMNKIKEKDYVKQQQCIFVPRFKNRRFNVSFFDLITKLMKVNPEDRYGFEDIEKHPAFTETFCDYD